MPRLIHLNGPPGIGKSTLAQMYADDHPGVLNLDIDRLRGMIGGWRERWATAIPSTEGAIEQVYEALTAFLGPGARSGLSGG